MPATANRRACLSTSLGIVVLAAIAGCRGTPGREPLVEGTITYRGEIGLTPADEIVVRIVDANDVTARPISDQRIQTDRQVPIRFALAYDPAVLEPEGRYVIQAQIWRNGRVLFATPEDVPIDPRQRLTDLVLELQQPAV